jgi:hypothetical protein
VAAGHDITVVSRQRAAVTSQTTGSDRDRATWASRFDHPSLVADLVLQSSAFDHGAGCWPTDPA